MSEPNEKVNLKSLPSVVLCVAAIICFVVLGIPQIAQTKSIKSDIWEMDEDIYSAHQIFERLPKERTDVALLELGNVSQVIKGIANLGNNMNIEFVSIEPKDVEADPKAPYVRQTIHLLMRSSFKDTGQFLSQLQDFKLTPIKVSAFEIIGKEAIKPQVKSKVVLAVFYKND